MFHQSREAHVDVRVDIEAEVEELEPGKMHNEQQLVDCDVDVGTLDEWDSDPSWDEPEPPQGASEEELVDFIANLIAKDFHCSFSTLT